MCVCMCIYMCVRVCACMCVCMYLCMLVCMCICMYVRYPYPYTLSESFFYSLDLKCLHVSANLFLDATDLFIYLELFHYHIAFQVSVGPSYYDIHR